MFCEDDEVVAEAAEAAAPVETAEATGPSDSGTEASDESVDVSGETAADALEETPELYNWNGEVEALREADWIKGLDMSVRESILHGVQSKYRNLERGYTKAYQENASKRKSLERRAQEIKDTELRVQKWLHGDIDPMEEKQRELEMLKQHHTSALETLHQEHEKALMKSQSGHAEEIEKLIHAREEANGRLAQFEADKEARKEAAMAAEVDSFEEWVKAEAPHVYADQDALYALCVNVASGIDKEKSLRMVLGAHPAPEPEPAAPTPAAPIAVPEAVEMMNMGASAAANTAPTNDLSFDERMDLLRRQAMADEAAFLNSTG